jgi:Flp pilus assembly protein TadG
MTRKRLQRNERGTLSIEAAIIGPTMLVFILVILAAGRYAMARQAVAGAADAAARAASISRTAEGGRAAATDVATASLQGKGVNCISRTIETDTTGFNAPLGVTASVTTQISCTVNFSDITLPGLPGSAVLNAQGRSVIDAYRERR